MKVSVAQTNPIKGNIKSNIDAHKKLIELAVLSGADTIIFPELSITGYEPDLAKELATDKEDTRFDIFQQLADTNQIIIGIGCPIKSSNGICISMVIFQPYKTREVYSKEYLHPDEEKFFVAGKNTISLLGKESNIALAICYEISVSEHSENAYKKQAKIYIASVVKTIYKIDLAIKTLSEIANKYKMTVLMSNCVGQANGNQCAGKTSIFNNNGLLLSQLDDTKQGILVIDTNTEEIVQKIL